MMRQVREQRSWLRDLGDPPVMRQVREQRSWLRDLGDPPMMRQVREQRSWLRDLADPPMMRQLREQQRQVLESLSSTAFAGVARWQFDLATRLEQFAEQVHEAPAQDVTSDDVATALGFDSTSELIWELQTLVEGLAIVATGMEFARAMFGFPISEELRSAIWLWIAVTFFALRLASGPPRG